MNPVSINHLSTTGTPEDLSQRYRRAKYCTMKFKTVKEGGQAVIFNYLGEGRLVIGPCRVYLFRERLQYLRRYTASQYEYLVVTNNTGLVTHVPGPVEMFCNPLEHQTMCVATATNIDANFMIVVYKKLPDYSVERRIIQGPAVFVPTAEEWLHTFKWHTPNPSEKGRYQPGGKDFTQLPAIPDQFDYEVREVRTIDDTTLTVRLMIFYELEDVIKMLDGSQDPIADMTNAVCSDIIAFAGKLTFQQFLENTQKMSQLDNYSQLKQRAEKIGYYVNKVVYRGYHSSEQLQAMQDSAIRNRTELRLNSELQSKKEQLEDFKLRKEKARTQMKQDMEKQRTEHRQRVEKTKQTHQLEMLVRHQDVALECERMVDITKLECEKASKSGEEGQLQALKELGVDLTRYLVNQGPAPVDQEYRITGNQREDQGCKVTGNQRVDQGCKVAGNQRPAPMLKANQTAVSSF